MQTKSAGRDRFGSTSPEARRSATVARATLGLVVVGWIWPSSAFAAPQEKVTICHATSAVSNPYTNPEVDVDSIVSDNGHDTHRGPVYPTPGWGDIIPPFEYTDKDTGEVVHYPGLNWTTEGMALWDGKCVAVLEPPDQTESPSPTETAEPSPTDTSEPPATDTSEPPATDTSEPPATDTSEPPATDTTEASERPSASSSETSESAPGTSEPPPGTSSPLPPGVTTSPQSPRVPPIAPTLVALARRVAIMPRLQAEAIEPGGRVVVLGQLTKAERVKLVDELRARLQVPAGAPAAGFGGVSASDDAGDGWLLVGAGFLALSALTGVAFARRRDDST